MAIDRVNISNRTVDEHRRLEKTPPAQSAGTGSGSTARSGSTDNLDLSARAKNIDRITRMVEQPEARAARLESVRAAIEAGTYEVSGDQIARKMIETNMKE